jgi:hypothetical protein
MFCKRNDQQQSGLSLFDEDELGRVDIPAFPLPELPLRGNPPVVLLGGAE